MSNEEKMVKEENLENKHQEEKQGRYEELLKLDENLWTYGCPVLFAEGILERDKVSQKNRLTLAFVNISQQVIRDLFIRILIKDGDEIEELEHSYLALGQPYMVTKGRPAKIAIKNEDARAFDIVIDKVVYEDGSIWYKKDAVLESAGAMDDIELFAQAKIKDYEDNYVSAKEALKEDDSLSINDSIEILKRIRWYKNSEELYRDAKIKYQVAKTNEDRKQASEERKANREKAVKRRYKITIGIIVLIVALAVASVFLYFIPKKNYDAAKDILKSEDYAKAAKEFEDLSIFLNSKSYLAQCYYKLGEAALLEADEELASDYFIKSYEAAPKSQYGTMAGSYRNYYEGLIALEEQNYGEAFTLFESSANAATDFSLSNKANVGMAWCYYRQGQYDIAWTTVKNVYAKDTSFGNEYGAIGYGYAEYLIGNEDYDTAIEVYNLVDKYTSKPNIGKTVYENALTIGETGDIAGCKELLSKVKDVYPKANKLYNKIETFEEKSELWLGTWRRKVVKNGKTKYHKITIDQVIFQGDICLKVKDEGNKKLGFETVISEGNNVTQIQVGAYIIKFKLKDFQKQKYTYTMKSGRKLERKMKYNGNTYTNVYKKVK